MTGINKIAGFICGLFYVPVLCYSSVWSCPGLFVMNGAWNLICTAVHQQEIRLVCFLEYEVHHLKHRKPSPPKENYTNLISQKRIFLWGHRGFLGGSCRCQHPIWCGSIHPVNHIFTCYLIEYITLGILTARIRVVGIEKKVFWNE
jgi:hypothetical protein